MKPDRGRDGRKGFPTGRVDEPDDSVAASVLGSSFDSEMDFERTSGTASPWERVLKVEKSTG